MKDPTKAVYERGFPPDGLSPDDVAELDEFGEMPEADAVGVLQYLLDAGAGLPQRALEDL
jgi:hypothetical protein